MIGKKGVFVFPLHQIVFVAMEEFAVEDEGRQPFVVLFSSPFHAGSHGVFIGELFLVNDLESVYPGCGSFILLITTMPPASCSQLSVAVSSYHVLTACWKEYLEQLSGSM